MTPASAQPALRPFTIGLNWWPEAEFGGLYQAVAEGRYEECGLAVTLLPGGPGINNRLHLANGQIQAYVGSNFFPSLRAASAGIPTVIVAAMFQNDPQILMSHPGAGLDTWESLAQAKASVSPNGLAFFFPWLVATQGFREGNLTPFSFSLDDFLKEPNVIRQGYITSEPLLYEDAMGVPPNVFLLSDHGFDSYASTLEVSRHMIVREPETVRCFVEATILGWNSYLYGDPVAAHFLIHSDNPAMSEEFLERSRQALIHYAIVDSGITTSLGLGAIDPQRVEEFARVLIEAGLLPFQIDPSVSYDLRFINQGLGLDYKERLQTTGSTRPHR